MPPRPRKPSVSKGGQKDPVQETARLIRNDPSRPTASELKDILEDRFTPNAILMSEDSQESRTGATQTAEIGVHMVTGIPIRTRKVTQQPSSPNIQEDSRAAEASAMHDRAPLNRNTEIKLVHPLPFDELSADSSKRRKIEETKIMG
ncbi:uncharacterized protein KY384_007282 [Bacidia gigantensis]|uniref:uncharacterized protein n=1 Tax=Bacidia gigantensis TaxID=2732470 RepID=UPI001D045416|nr:uncharacterized protein KY384_007282 [Bacidia gigantensis]KAG8528364.1 hypothetical protein KY384_007282 [Bacidia gigantensis]